MVWHTLLIFRIKFFCFDVSEISAWNKIIIAIFLFKEQNIDKGATYSWKQHTLASHTQTYSHQETCFVKLGLTE